MSKTKSLPDDDAEPTGPRRFAFRCGSLSSPPLSETIRRQAGRAIRKLQDRLPLPPTQYKTIREIGPGCGEIRLVDGELHKEWRFFVYLDSAEIVLLHYEEKKTQKTPRRTIDLCRQRLAHRG